MFAWKIREVKSSFDPFILFQQISGGINNRISDKSDMWTPLETKIHSLGRIAAAMAAWKIRAIKAPLRFVRRSPSSHCFVEYNPVENGSELL